MTGPDLEAVHAFVFREARLLDERRYEDWLEIWANDRETLYWVPADDDLLGGDEAISFVYDNRARLATRVKQLLTGERYSQVPTSTTVRLVSNVEARRLAAGPGDDTGDIRVLTSFALHEYRLGRSHTWAGRTEYLLAGRGSDMRLASKKVVLVNRTGAVPSMAFLL